ncbi:MAG: hypothetical protein RJA19_1488, partial [Bacteroidota bacterium]
DPASGLGMPNRVIHGPLVPREHRLWSLAFHLHPKVRKETGASNEEGATGD